MQWEQPAPYKEPPSPQGEGLAHLIRLSIVIYTGGGSKPPPYKEQPSPQGEGLAHPIRLSIVIYTGGGSSQRPTRSHLPRKGKAWRIPLDCQLSIPENHTSAGGRNRRYTFFFHFFWILQKKCTKTGENNHPGFRIFRFLRHNIRKRHDCLSWLCNHQ